MLINQESFEKTLRHFLQNTKKTKELNKLEAHAGNVVKLILYC